MLELGGFGLFELIILEFELRLFILVDGGRTVGLPDVTLVELLPDASLPGCAAMGALAGAFRLTELEFCDLDEA